MTLSQNRHQILARHVRPPKIPTTKTPRKTRQSFRTEIRGVEQTRTAKLVKRPVPQLAVTKLPQPTRQMLSRRVRLQLSINAVKEAVAVPRQLLRSMEETLALPFRRKKRQVEIRIPATRAAKGAIVATTTEVALAKTLTIIKDRTASRHRLSKTMVEMFPKPR